MILQINCSVVNLINVLKIKCEKVIKRMREGTILLCYRFSSLEGMKTMVTRTLIVITRQVKSLLAVQKNAKIVKDEFYIYAKFWAFANIWAALWRDGRN